MGRVHFSVLRQRLAIRSVKWGGLLILTLVSALLYNHFFLSRAYVEFEYWSEKGGTIKMMWAGDGEEYSRDNAARGRLRKGKDKCGFFLGDLRKIRYLRLDPVDQKDTRVLFHSITISQPGMSPLVFADKDSFNRFQVGADIASIIYDARWGWTVTTNGRNGNLHLVLDPAGKRRLNIPIEAGRFFVLLFLVHGLFRILASLNRNDRYVPLLLCGIVLLVTVMALCSPDGAHPDEEVHKAAAAWYEGHWLMPAMDSDEIAHSYSVYGISRLNSREISYFFAGKFAALVQLFHLPGIEPYRLFNVSLFALLALLSYYSLPARVLAIPLLLTPQAWYIFSYCNSDAFALFLALVVSWQMVDKDSLFNGLLQDKKNVSQAVFLLAPLMAALLMIKKNYYFFVIFVLLYLVSGFAFKRYRLSRTTVKKFVLLVCAGLSLVVLRSGADIMVNGFDKGVKIQQIREEKAEYMYKPSTPLAEQHPHLHLRDRGVTLERFFTEYRWGGKILRSFYGVYGYMTVSGSTAYYTLMGLSGFFFLGFLLLTVLIQGGWWEKTLVLNLVVCGLALVGTACYRTWIMDFQAQGRYLLVLLPMLGVLLAHTKDLFQPLVLRSFILYMFFMSLINFLFVGLRGMAATGLG